MSSPTETVLTREGSSFMWNNDAVKVQGMLERGCIPATGVSYEFSAAYFDEMQCWSESGSLVECGDIPSWPTDE